VEPQSFTPSEVQSSQSKGFFKNKFNLFLISFILICIVGLGGFYYFNFLIKPSLSPSFSVNSIYEGEWQTPGYPPLPSTITVMSLKNNKANLKYTWGDKTDGGFELVEAEFVTNNRLEWGGSGVYPVKFTLTIENDGTLRGTRTQARDKATIIMKKVRPTL
jgi:hypothetical protein